MLSAETLSGYRQVFADSVLRVNSTLRTCAVQNSDAARTIKITRVKDLIMSPWQFIKITQQAIEVFLLYFLTEQIFTGHLFKDLGSLTLVETQDIGNYI